MNNSPEITAAKFLKTTRLRLLLTREQVSKCTKVPTTTIERIENGELPYPMSRFQDLVSFYNHSMEEVYSNREIPDWIELRRRFLAKHQHDDSVMQHLSEKPGPKEVILYRMLTSKTLDEFISTSNLISVIKSRYNWVFLKDRMQNALDSIVKDGLIIRSPGRPYEYKRKSNNLPEEIDSFYHLTRKLEEIPYANPDNLVNPAYRKMSIILKHLNGIEDSRKNLMELVRLKNESNNISRTIKVLEDLLLIEKTEKASTSKFQKYRLTIEGEKLLKK
ncbi:hypothetical protein ORI89_10185 [Sphingobacterium sp. UT-1RO-CII-1]|uniref:hypothetical protein n=1 Tax=Sphingobacterium sp. UT-1RO-CII-1 TaxID=2995225 RepID=UPI00227BB11D|nr:hypothetical protein [Sphingobacterium sp. UT-1RO-CII-1]MCY4780019.1 hypothetical protein [Sphingobacterium sp. UT-1RO-CII-1]